MAEGNDFAMGYALGQDSGGGNNGGGGFGGGWDGIWGIILLAMILGWGNGGFGGGFGGGGGASGALTRAELYDGFALQNIDSAVRGVQQGICDSTYALNNSIMSGFHGVDNAICTLGYQMKDCCCETQRLIERGFADTNYNMANQFCGLQNTMNNNTRDIIESQNSGTRAILDFLVQEKLTSKDAQIAQLQNQLSQSNQNAVIGARIDSAVAEVLRRTGNDCPTAAYLVQPPTPVNFPTNGCGTVQFGGYGGNGYGGNSCGCSCGCG